MIFIINKINNINNKMSETNDYWIVDNKLIFKPIFKKPISNYYDLISSNNILIFSNYNNVNICIETNNKYDLKYNYHFSLSNFNHPIELPQNITHLVFGYKFNKQVILPQNITHLEFGTCFNQ